MSIEDSLLLDNETIDSSTIKRSFLKLYHQQAANINASDQNNDFIFGEKNNYHQIGNAYLQYELTIEKEVAVAAIKVLVNGEAIKSANIAFAYCFREARL